METGCWRKLTRNQTLDLPGDLAAGDTYYILAVVDPWNAIPELFEDNHISFSRMIRVN